MGEIADMVVNGEICQECLAPVEDAPHCYPVTCTECGGDKKLDLGYDKEECTHEVPDTPCPKCGTVLRTKWSGVECPNQECDYWLCF